METELKKILLQIGDLKKSFMEIQTTICNICRKESVKEKQPSLLTIDIVLPEDYD